MHKIHCTGSSVVVGKFLSAIFNCITKLFDNILVIQLQTIDEGKTDITQEFQVTESKTEVIKELCRIVAYYYLVEAVDNGSDIHSKLTVNANDALTYWVRLLLLLG